jgi:hypothetical protein
MTSHAPSSFRCPDLEPRVGGPPAVAEFGGPFGSECGGRAQAVSVQLFDGNTDPFDPAIKDIVRLILALRAAIDALDYALGARTRGELVVALARTQALVDRADASGTQAAMQQELRRIRAITSVILEIAPAPTAAAVEAATRGNETLWAAEEHAWTVGRLVSEWRSRAARQRYRTRPDSPALRAPANEEAHR